MNSPSNFIYFSVFLVKAFHFSHSSLVPSPHHFSTAYIYTISTVVACVLVVNRSWWVYTRSVAPSGMSCWAWYGINSMLHSFLNKWCLQVHCEILSVIQNSKVHAYLLRFVTSNCNQPFSSCSSESSLFVWPYKFILKTCGTTVCTFIKKNYYETRVAHYLGPSFDIHTDFAARPSRYFENCSCPRPERGRRCFLQVTYCSLCLANSILYLSCVFKPSKLLLSWKTIVSTQHLPGRSTRSWQV